MDYSIYSASERGFWNNKLGWVDDIQNADRFSEREKTELNRPMSSGSDAQWIVVNTHGA